MLHNCHYWSSVKNPKLLSDPINKHIRPIGSIKLVPLIEILTFFLTRMTEMRRFVLEGSWICVELYTAVNLMFQYASIADIDYYG